MIDVPPPCPICGAPPAGMEIGTRKTIPRGGGLPICGPEGIPLVFCSEGHYYTEDGHACGPPPNVTVDMRGAL